MLKPLEGVEVEPKTKDKLEVEEDRGVKVDGGAEEEAARLEGEEYPSD